MKDHWLLRCAFPCSFSGPGCLPSSGAPAIVTFTAYAPKERLIIPQMQYFLKLFWRTSENTPTMKVSDVPLRSQSGSKLFDWACTPRHTRAIFYDPPPTNIRELTSTSSSKGERGSRYIPRPVRSIRYLRLRHQLIYVVVVAVVYAVDVAWPIVPTRPLTVTYPPIGMSHRTQRSSYDFGRC